MYLICLQYILDLHGFYDVNDAIWAVERFIDRFTKETGWHKVLITGRGRNSPNGCVIKPVVIKWLDERGFRHKFTDDWECALEVKRPRKRVCLDIIL
ncbi:hypothetical protein HOLleu_41976 [Holothuria leucospilota]|uniref:Smr domain-containing protein n=1 Tax=Holothuria leucospilota TaxID=206669 RepID=A0A9Q0YK02_HOLLE|nr:hypothetical protein HOLleu_41976 [Holothuria leucospilota]